MAIKVRWMLTFKRRRGLCLGWRTQMGGFNDISPYKNLLSCTFALWLPSAGKESACNVGDLGSIPGLGRSPGEGKGYPLQYSGLENSMDCIVHGVAKSRTWLSDFQFTHMLLVPSSLYIETMNFHSFVFNSRSTTQASFPFFNFLLYWEFLFCHS